MLSFTSKAPPHVEGDDDATDCYARSRDSQFAKPSWSEDGKDEEVEAREANASKVCHEEGDCGLHAYRIPAPRAGLRDLPQHWEERIAGQRRVAFADQPAHERQL